MKLTTQQQRHERSIAAAYREMVAAGERNDRAGYIAAWERMKGLIQSREPVVMLEMEMQRLERVQS
jgi:hypothetical protein